MYNLSRKAICFPDCNASNFVCQNGLPCNQEAEEFMTHSESISNPVYMVYRGQWGHHTDCDNPIDFFSL